MEIATDVYKSKDVICVGTSTATNRSMVPAENKEDKTNTSKVIN